MGKYKAYSEYRESGVGKLPSHWDISKNRFLFNFSRGLGITKANLQDEGIPCVSYGEVHSKYGFEVNASKHELRCVDESYLLSSPRCLIEPGAFIFADTSEDLEGAGNFSQVVGDKWVFAGYHTIVLRLKESENSRYFAYLFDSPEFRTQIQQMVKGVKVFSVTQEILKSAAIWKPSLQEQVQIAKFLDHETTKIDMLIGRQERLIELLQEKRQAVISHAVTKGLDGAVGMKDSGVEWLGEVPEHWDITKVGFFTEKVGSGKTPRGGAEVYPEEGVLFLRSQNVYSDGLRIEESDCVYISEFTHQEMGNSQVSGGDILLNITGASIGRTCLIPEEFQEANVNQHVCIIRVPKIFREYFAYYLKSTLIEDQINRAQTGSSREGLNFEQISKLIITLPPEGERIDIVRYIKDNEKKFNYLELKSKEMVVFLKERRTALISAAVTGKIDVRDVECS